MGVSGSGKGTLRENLKKSNIKNIKFLRSYVTREMRPGEKSGDQYWFISQEDFETAIQRNDFLEYEWVHKAGYYGTKQREVLEWITNGEILLKEIETKWLKQIIEKHSYFKENFTSFFLDVPNDAMVQRYLERHPEGQEDDIENRLESARLEREQATQYCDYIIDAAQSPEKVLEDILQIIHKHAPWSFTL